MKKFLLFLLIFCIGYASLYLPFIWGNSAQLSTFNQTFASLSIKGVHFFGVSAYPLHSIDGREAILSKKNHSFFSLEKRLQRALYAKHPVTFSEKELNFWLAKHLRMKSTLEPLVKPVGVWVHLQKDNNLEILMEREIKGIGTHLTSMTMHFENSKGGFRIYYKASRIGAAQLPGSFSRLISPAFSHLADSLKKNLQPYHDKKFEKITVSDGLITLYPRNR